MMKAVTLSFVLVFLVSCKDEFPEADVLDTSTSTNKPLSFVSLETKDKGLFVDKTSPPSWWMRNNSNETIFFGARSAEGDILTFSLNYDGELETPSHFKFDRRGEVAAINATINGFNYTTVTSSYDNKLNDFDIDLESKLISGNIDVVLISPDTEEEIKIVGSFKTYKWNLMCVNNGEVDFNFKSDFCNGFEEYR